MSASKYEKLLSKFDKEDVVQYAPVTLRFDGGQELHFANRSVALEFISVYEEIVNRNVNVFKFQEEGKDFTIEPLDVYLSAGEALRGY